MIVDHLFKSSLSRLGALFQRASLEWWLGCLAIIVPSIVLLAEWCRSCQSQNLTQAVVLPSIGLTYGLALLGSRLFLSNSAWQNLFDLSLVVAGFAALPALGLFLLGHHHCLWCIAIWGGIMFLFLMELPERRIFSFVQLSWAVGLNLLFASWLYPPANLEMKRLLIGLGFSQPSIGHGLAVGSQVPAQPKLPLNATILFWTNCPCPLVNTEKTLQALRQRGETPIIIALALVPEMRRWAPNSSVYIVDIDTFQQWDVSPDLPHLVLSIRTGLVTANRSVNTMEKK